MTDYWKIWRNPIRIGIAASILISYSALWVNGFDMVMKLLWGGVALFFIVVALFSDWSV